MVTNTFTNGTTADADEVNQNFTDVEDYTDEQDGFTYIETDTVSSNATSPTTVKTYTFNKAVDGVIIESVYNCTANGAGYVRFYKNDVLLTESDISILEGSYSSSVFRYFSTSDDAIYVNGPGASTIRVGSTIRINTSFTATDTLKMKMESTNTIYTVYSYGRTITGVKNKSSDTTWVSVS